MRASESSSAGVNAILWVEEWLEDFARTSADVEVSRQAHHRHSDSLFSNRVSIARLVVHFQSTDVVGAQLGNRQNVRRALGRSENSRRRQSQGLEVRSKLPHTFVLHQRSASRHRCHHRSVEECEADFERKLGWQDGDDASFAEWKARSADSDLAQKYAANRFLFIL